MRALSLAALRLDPQLTDAYMGVGLYNYFVDTLPTIVKLLRFLIALPGGSRELGLEQLSWAAQKGDVTRADAKFQLAKDYSRSSEKQYAKSLNLFQEFEREYPHNPLWPLLAADLECRLDRVQPCEASYREVLRQTAGEKAQAKRVVHAAALRALERLHPEEKIE
jgi:predicted Zn-dependent protease